MSLIILTTLGAGRYSEAQYRWGERPPITTQLVSAALSAWFPEAEVLVLLTPKANEVNGALLRELLPQHRAIEITNGETEEDNWDLFEAVAQGIPAGSEVIFDITHGFRSLPVLTLLALSYLRIVRQVKLRAVVYGAFEAGQATTPIFDLTPFVGLLDWAQAANRFQDTGDATLFKKLLEMKQRADYNAVSRQLEVVSKAIFGNRGLQIPSEAAKLLQVLATAQQGQLASHQRPFALVMQQLEAQVRPLAAGHDPQRHDPSHTDELTLQAEYALILWYAQRGHFPQAMSLAREWLISVRQWHELGRISMDEKEREHINADVWQSINALQGGANKAAGGALYAGLDAKYQAYASALDKVNRQRNDLMHFGFKGDATPATTLHNKVGQALDLLPAAVLPLGLVLEGHTPS